MASKRRNVVGDTPYQTQLREVIMRSKKGELLDSSGAVTYSFTPAWLAAQFGRKVTPDFRKAMNKFEDEGLIEAYYFPAPISGLSKAYTTQISQQTGDVTPYVNWESEMSK